MKKLNMLLALGLSLCAMTATAGVEEIISTKTVNLPVDLSTAGIRLSNRGYGERFFVKILVPQLADNTLMNHRNEGESAPCVATFQTGEVEDVVKGKPETLTVPFTIEVKRVVYANPNTNQCSIALHEDVSAEVRGYKFVHHRQIQLPERGMEDCR